MLVHPAQMSTEFSIRLPKPSCIPFWSPLDAPSKTTRMNMPHAIAKPVIAVRKRLREIDDHISDNIAILNTYDAIGCVRYVLFVSYNDSGYTLCVELFEYVHDFDRCLAVKCSGRFVSE